MNPESGFSVDTMKLGQLAKDVVDAKILEGQCKGRTGWAVPDNDLLNTRDMLQQRLQLASYNKDWATVLVYAAMLQARIYNGIDQVAF